MTVSSVVATAAWLSTVFFAFVIVLASLDLTGRRFAPANYKSKSLGEVPKWVDDRSTVAIGTDAIQKLS